MKHADDLTEDIEQLDSEPGTLEAGLTHPDQVEGRLGPWNTMVSAALMP